MKRYLVAAAAGSLTLGVLGPAGMAHASSTATGVATAAYSTSAYGTSSHHRSLHKVNKEDRTWFAEASAGDLFEIQLGRVAEQRAVYRVTYLYAARLIRDHTRAYAQKRAIARALGLKLSTSPTPDMIKEMRDVEKHKGTAFDVSYLKTEISDHVKDISDTKKEIRSGRSCLVVGQARRELPVLQTHLALGRAALRVVEYYNHHH
jgi:putative membrane protein